MSLSDGAYSRLVNLLKLVLPLLALAILSTLFFFSRTVDPGRTIDYSDDEIADLANDPRITAPQYYGVAEDGSALTLVADTIRPEGAAGERVRADGLRLRVEDEAGQWLTLNAPAGEFDTVARRARFTEAVTVAASNGITAETDTIEADLDSGTVTSGTPLTATAPFGRLTANALWYGRASDRTDAKLLVFSGGVKLVYQPPE